MLLVIVVLLAGLAMSTLAFRSLLPFESLPAVLFGIAISMLLFQLDGLG